MPEGPFGGPRFSNFGPLSRSTSEEIRSEWSECNNEGKEAEISQSIKYHALRILENQGIYPEVSTLVAINSGECYTIAESVLEEIDGVRVYGAGLEHVWITYNDKHFDAEAPCGVNDPLDLPFFRRVAPRQVLDFVRMQAEGQEGEQPPSSVDEMITDVTEDYR